jgi:DNA-binding MarR family transcriptional regulator
VLDPGAELVPAGFKRIEEGRVDLLVSFLLVVEHEGKGVTEYAELAEVAPTVMTRHLLDIGARDRRGEEGFGWITQERDKKDLRRQHATLTPEGRRVAQSGH